MDIIDLNPIENIIIRDDIMFLETKHLLYNYEIYEFNDHIIDNEFAKFGAFVYNDIDVKNLLEMNNEELDLYELISVRTTTNVSMAEQKIIFEISTSINNKIDINKLKKCILYPKLLNINDKMVSCFLVNDIVKTRFKKIKKIHTKNINKNDI